MGNQLIKNTEIEKEPFTQGGHSLIWQVYRGTKQDQLQTKVCIFQLEKKNYEKKFSKPQSDEINVFLRKEGQSLLKFKHPQILSLLEPPLEDQKFLAFMTEPFSNNLQDLINKNEVNKLYGSELEFKIHIQELLQVVNYLHNEAKIVHLNINPENIYVALNGKWKLAGFHFSAQLLDLIQDTQGILYDNMEVNSYVKRFPLLSYTAPEVASVQSKCSFASDVFSIGMLILSFYQYSHQKTCKSKTGILKIENRNQYEETMQNLKLVVNEEFFQKFDPSLQALLIKMLDKNYQNRPNVAEILHSQWLNDPYVRALYNLETITNVEQAQQIKFLQGFQKIIFQYNEKLIKDRIMNSLFQLLKFDALVPPILSIIIEMLKKENFLTKAEFQSLIWPYLKFITQGKEISAQSLWSILFEIEIFHKYNTPENFENYLMPLVLKCFDCSVPKIQNLALEKTEFFFANFPYQTYIKQKILPRLLNLIVTKSIDVRKPCILFFKKNIAKFDKQTLQEQVIAALLKCQVIGNPLDLQLTILEMIKQISQDMQADCIATKILPQLIPCLTDANFSKQQYQEYSKTIKVLLEKIDQEKFKVLPDAKVNVEQSQKQLDPINQIINQQTQNQPVITQNSSNDFDFLDMFQNPINNHQQVLQQQPPVLAQNLQQPEQKTSNQVVFQQPLQQSLQKNVTNQPVQKPNQDEFDIFSIPKPQNPQVVVQQQNINSKVNQVNQPTQAKVDPILQQLKNQKINSNVNTQNLQTPNTSTLNLQKQQIQGQTPSTQLPFQNQINQVQNQPQKVQTSNAQQNNNFNEFPMDLNFNTVISSGTETNNQNQSFGYQNLSQPVIIPQNTNQKKGNLATLDYDPFSEITESTINQPVVVQNQTNFTNQATNNNILNNNIQNNQQINAPNKIFSNMVINNQNKAQQPIKQDDKQLQQQVKQNTYQSLDLL